MSHIIVVPKNIDAMQHLEYGDIVANESLQLILKHEDIVSLWESSFLYNINILADVNIDYGEEESIIDLTKLEMLINSGLFEIMFKNEELNRIIASIKVLFLAAIQYKTGVFFFF